MIRRSKREHNGTAPVVGACAQCVYWCSYLIFLYNLAEPDPSPYSSKFQVLQKYSSWAPVELNCPEIRCSKVHGSFQCSASTTIDCPTTSTIPEPDISKLERDMGWSVRFATVDSRMRTHSHVHGKPISGAPEAQVCRLCGPAQLIAPWLPYSSLASVQLERDMRVGQFSFARVVSRIRNRCHVSCGAISGCSASTAQVPMDLFNFLQTRLSKDQSSFHVRTTSDCPTTATPPEPGIC